MLKQAMQDIETKFINGSDWNMWDLKKHVKDIPLETKEKILEWYILERWNQEQDKKA